MARVRVLGGGWYGCHIARALLGRGHEVTLHESSSRLFSGASGNMPGRLHLGFHYPRSRLTRAACQDHYAKFMEKYGHLTHGVPVNLYAIAANSSLVDFGNYCQSLRPEVEFINVVSPAEYGLRQVEGALLTSERHTLLAPAREFFTDKLKAHIEYGVTAERYHENEYDLTVDCTFCARDNLNVDRYEPCLTAILKGDVSKAVTIMDGPFPSLYPWNEELKLLSLTSARWTPLSKECKTYGEAKDIIERTSGAQLSDRTLEMLNDMEVFYPQIRKYEVVQYLTAIRAMPLSGADARLVDVVKVSDKTIRIRASKLDAIFYAEEEVCRLLS